MMTYPEPLPAGTITVALAQPLATDTAILVRIGEAAIAIFDVGGSLHAIDDVCMRCCASLTQAKRDGARITCGCEWTYDLVTGAVEGMPSLRLDKFEVVRDGDAIRVGMLAA